MNKQDFGDEFIWGVATASYQIEGAHNKEGKGLSIWDTFSENSKKIKNGANGNIACDHFHRFENDFSLINQLAIPNYRFSLSWSRIFPNGIGKVNQQGVDFYHRLIDDLLAKNIIPWVTLYHWDLPQALEDKGGWTNREILNWFEEYVTFCVKTFGDKVKHWMVLNEPMVFTGAGYFLGIHAPGRKGLKNFLPAMHHATLAQALGGKIIKELYPNSEVGTTFSCSYITPHSQEKRDINAAKRMDALLNRLYIEPLIGLGYPIKELKVLEKVETFFHADDEKNMVFDFDFIGIQNYTREVAKWAWYVPMIWGKLVNAKARKVPYTTMEWEVYPESIYQMLKKFSAYPNVRKVLVTENGAAFHDVVKSDCVHDKRRVDYLKKYIQQILRAKNEGINVQGYFVWTLMDNFEWAEGFNQRFGLIHIDYHTQERIIKDSGYWYADFLRNR